MSNRQKQKQYEVDRIVASINETRCAEHFRSPDRPDSRFVKSRRQDPAIGRAKARLRTATYRNRLDQRRAASTYQIAMSLVMALVTSNLSSMTTGDRDLVGRALVDLQSRGYDLNEVKHALRRLRRRVVASEDTENDSPVAQMI